MQFASVSNAGGLPGWCQWHCLEMLGWDFQTPTISARDFFRRFRPHHALLHGERLYQRGWSHIPGTGTKWVDGPSSDGFCKLFCYLEHRPRIFDRTFMRMSIHSIIFGATFVKLCTFFGFSSLNPRWEHVLNLTLNDIFYHFLIGLSHGVYSQLSFLEGLFRVIIGSGKVCHPTEKKKKTPTSDIQRHVCLAKEPFYNQIQ